MKLNRILISSFLTVALAGLCSAQAAFVDGVDLTTNKAPWTMRILGNDLDITNVQAKPDEASAYFMMASASTKLNVSVFIEPVGKCKTSEECRDHVLALGNPDWGKYEQLAKGKLKDLSYFEFYRPQVEGQPAKILDMYAEYVSQGFWVDVHISKVLYTKQDHALFEKVVNSITFIPKAVEPNTAFDTQLGKGQKTVAAWLSLWQSQKCKETYAALTSISRSGLTVKDWTDNCLGMNKEFGNNRSRKLIAAAFARSLPETTDRPLAVLAFHSSFANNPSVVEMIALLQEKDGTWSMANYLIP